MIVNCDAKALEVYCGAYLSRDKVMMQELLDGLDMHTNNQEAFNLPSRLIAKVLMFRIMYGGSGYSFAHDPDFTDVSSSEKYWTNKIEVFYDKYKGFRKWHETIVKEAVQNGKLVMPTGRVYTFELKKDFRGELKAPETIIKNYPVQGLGADLMSIARVSFAKRFKAQKIRGLQVNTVHDSIVCDVEEADVEQTVALFHEVFKDIPTNFQKLFGVPFDLPMLCEVQIGKNMKEIA